MANRPASRNLFADPRVPSFAELIVRIRGDRELPKRTRQNWLWALHAVARAVGKEPLAVPAHPEFLRKVMARAAPAAVGLRNASWNNARSLCGKVLEWAGLASMPAHYQAPFAPAWAELWELLPARTSLSVHLSRLFHYASARGLAPNQITDEVLEAFHLALVAESIVRNPYKAYRNAAKNWNNAIKRFPDWPPQRLKVPSRQLVVSLPWTEFPASFVADMESYFARASGLDLDDEHFTRAQRPATIETRRKQLRLFASAIVQSGVPKESIVDLRTTLLPEFSVKGLQYRLGQYGGKSTVHISNIAEFLPTLARRLDMPEEVVTRLRKISRKLKITRSGMTERNREALRAFDDPSAVEALLTLPHRIMREIEASGQHGRRAAQTVQTALAVELLLNAPVRRQNLASIELDRHLIEVGARGTRVVHLHFPAEEVKNRNDLEFPLMPESARLLDTYLAQWRPLLVRDSSRFLFPGKLLDRHKDAGLLSKQIQKLVYAHTRLDMPAHRFRHAVAKIYLDRNPGQYEVVRQLLGHKSIKTTISFYAGAETATAARHYVQTVLGQRGIVPEQGIQNGRKFQPPSPGRRASFTPSRRLA